PSWWRRLSPACAAVAQDDLVALSAASGDQTKDDELFALSVLPPVHFAVPSVADSEALSRVLGARTEEAETGDAPEARVGSAMHRLLEWAPLDAQDFSAGQIEHVALQFALTIGQARQAAAMAQRILRGEGAWAWRSAEVAWWGNE
ncbi:hypothetical protein ACQV5M_21965, partial [Leptospira sp. SA-E8]|uniref:hypothetical protein n=1 Tax=Leptospira sp. SA-E8 TaxID=3422259 RepID=UPI003EB86E37